jgi:hypothetical protein
MLFNPFSKWLTKGPFNKLFVGYISNKYIKWYQKVAGRPKDVRCSGLPVHALAQR